MYGSRPRMRDCSAAHGAEWQDLEQIFRRLLQHGNMRERREGVAHASLRPVETIMRVSRRSTEAARFCARKGPNDCQLIFPGVQRFLRHTCAAHFRIVYIHAKRRVHYIYIRKH